MDFKNITLKGDNITYNKSIFSNNFIYDSNGVCWLDSKSIKLLNSSYTSFGISWEQIEHAEAYAVFIVNYDATKIFGFPFIHWSVCNIPNNHLEPSASINNSYIKQGVNSGVTLATANQNGIIYDVLPSGYKNASFEKSIGFYPLLTFDRPCMYTIKVIGLNKKNIEIENGFFLDELLTKVNKHIVGMHVKNFWHSGANKNEE